MVLPRVAYGNVIVLELQDVGVDTSGSWTMIRNINA